jgi:hypothetical protein
VQGFWISQLFTKPSILFSRLAFCFLYLRIFNGLGKQRRQIIYLVMTLISLYYTIAFIVTAFFNCQPIKKNWLKATPGTCINQAAFIYTNAAMNIFIDALVVALPIPDIGNPVCLSDTAPNNVVTDILVARFSQVFCEFQH